MFVNNYVKLLTYDGEISYKAYIEEVAKHPTIHNVKLSEELFRLTLI